MVPWRATEEGYVTEDVIDWYERFARGMPGAIVVEATGIRDVPSGPLLRIGHDRFLPGLTRLVETVRRVSEGRTRLLIQLIDFLTIRRRPEPKKFFEIPDEDWSRFFEVNVMSGVRLSRAYLPGMLKRNWGRIIFISSESALNIPTEMIHYGMTKTAQLAIARGLAKLTRGTAVTVNSVLPGPTLSEGVDTMVKELARQSGQSEAEVASNFVKQHRPSSLLQRFASVEEVANMVVYVASREASATNGAALKVEGGIVNSIC